MILYKMRIANKYWRASMTAIVFLGGLFVFNILLSNQRIKWLLMNNENRRDNWEQSSFTTNTSLPKTENSLPKAENSLPKAENSFLKAENSFLKKENSFLKAENSFLKAENSSLIMKQKLNTVLSLPNTVPSLLEDWGKLECPLTKLSPDKQNFFDYLTDITLPCEKQVTVGGKIFGNKKSKIYFFDGEKYICLDASFNLIYDNCVSLSFGIGSDWSFDDEMDKTYGCKVYAFDPTIGVKDHNRSQNIRFFNMGISNGPGKMGSGKLESYSEILKMLNLENTTIDYLKMDVEGSEWRFFKDVLTKTPNLLKNVRQIGMEIHLEKENLPTVWNYFQSLHCFGFRIMASHYNPTESKRVVKGKRRATYYEIVWGQDRKW